MVFTKVIEFVLEDVCLSNVHNNKIKSLEKWDCYNATSKLLIR